MRIEISLFCPKFTLPKVIAPTQISDSNWSIQKTGNSLEARIAIFSVPPDAEDIAYDIDGDGVERSLTTNQTGIRVIVLGANDVTYAIRLKAKNFAGGTWSTSKNVILTASSQSAAISIMQRSALQIAPEAVFFEVSLSGFDSTGPGGGEVYDARLHEVYYHWDFGDNYIYSKLTKVPTAFRNSQYGYGPFGSHTYRAAGTYTVTCTVFEPSSGKSAVAATQIVIGDPDTVFTANNQTLILDSTGTGIGAYPSATVLTSFDALIDKIKDYNDEARPRRVIVRRGQTFTTNGKKIGNDNWPTVHFLAESGAGDDPVINSIFDQLTWKNGHGTAIKDFVMQGLKMVGGWDATTESGTTNNGIAIWNNPPQQFLLDGVTLQDFGGRALSNTENNMDSHPYRIFLNDCFVDGWRFYGVFLTAARLVSLTGTKIDQDPLANAGGPKDDVHNNHGPFRIARADSSTQVVAHSSEFYSRNAWNAAKGVWGQQPCWRMDTSGIGGGAYSVHCNVFEGGVDVIEIKTQSDTGSDSHRVNAVFAQNYILGTHMTKNVVSIEKAGVTFRNNIMVVPDTPEYASYYINRFVKIKWDGVVSGEEVAPIQVYSNTMINLNATAIVEFKNVTDDGTFSDVTVENNVVYQPNIGAPQISDGPLDSTPFFTPSELGYKDDAIDLLSAYATNPADVWSGSPLIGSAALGDTNDTLPFAYDDFLGNPRPQYPSRGAFEML